MAKVEVPSVSKGKLFDRAIVVVLDSVGAGALPDAARFGDEALEFISGCRPEQPFCLSVSFNAPHARDGQAREFPPDPRD